MPGTIQVTVLEFKGAASASSNPSAKSLKVSMGKRYYQTWDKGDFSFPVTKLKEDLIVKLLDAGENEIAHADIGTIEVIEKGYWDEVFSLEGEGGGGHVHMKLQFILSDEERKRIRDMRESAMKKKQESNPAINLRLSDSSDAVQTSARSEGKISDTLGQIDVVRPKVEASKADPLLNSSAEQERRIVGSEIPIQVEGASSSLISHEIQAEPPQVYQSVQLEKIETHSPISISDKKNAVTEKLGDDLINKSQNRGPQKVSSNVRKMISAFETQEPKSSPKAPKIVVQVQPADQSFKKTLNENLPQSEKHSNVENMFRNVPKELIVNEIGKSPSDVLRQEDPIMKESEKSSHGLTRQSISKTAINSGRIHEKQSRVEDVVIEALNDQVVKEMKKSGVYETALETSTSLGQNHEEQSRETDLKALSSNEKPKSLEYYSTESSGIWIFPDNTRRLCITTAGDPSLEAKQNTISPEPEISEKKNSASPKESGSSSSPDVSFNGLIGQVLKVVAILGFGALVFLTRQKEPRKKNREENGHLFTIPNYIDGTTLIE